MLTGVFFIIISKKNLNLFYELLIVPPIFPSNPQIVNNIIMRSNVKTLIGTEILVRRSKFPKYISVSFYKASKCYSESTKFIFRTNF